MSDSRQGDDIAAVQKCEQTYNRIRDELSKVIVGQERLIDRLLVALLAVAIVPLVAVNATNE